MAFVHPRNYRDLYPRCCDDCMRRQAFRYMGGENGTAGVPERTDVPAAYLADYRETYWSAYRAYWGQPTTGGDGRCPSCGCAPETRGQQSPTCVRHLAGRGGYPASACSCHWPPVVPERPMWTANLTLDDQPVGTERSVLCESHLGLYAASYTRYWRTLSPTARCAVCGAHNIVDQPTEEPAHA